MVKSNQQRINLTHNPILLEGVFCIKWQRVESKTERKIFKSLLNLKVKDHDA